MPLIFSGTSSSSPVSSTRPTQLHRPRDASGTGAQRSSSWSAWAVKPLQHVRYKARSSSYGQGVSASPNIYRADLGRLANFKSWRRKREDKKNETSDGNGTVRRNVVGGKRFPSGVFVKSSLEELREDVPLEVVSDDADPIGDDSMPVPGAWLEEQQQPGAGRPDYSHWTDLRQRLEEQAKLSEQKQQKRADKRGPSSKNVQPDSHRVVSQEDYLTARGANPRTGVVSPTVVSMDTTSGTRNSHEGPKHFVPNQKWRLKGDQWISIDAGEQTPPMTPPIDESAQADEAAASRPMGNLDSRMMYLDEKYNGNAPPVPDPGRLSMTTRQIVDYYKAIERVYRDGGEMLPPNALPTPRAATPEGRSTPPLKLNKLRNLARLKKDDRVPQKVGEAGAQSGQTVGLEGNPDNAVDKAQQPTERHIDAPLPKQLYRARDALQRAFRGDGPQSSAQPVSEQESFLGNGEARGESRCPPNTPASLTSKGSHSPPPPWTNEPTTCAVTEDQEMSGNRTRPSRFYPSPNPTSMPQMAMGTQPDEKVLRDLPQQAKFLQRPVKLARKPCITTITTTTMSTPTSTTVLGHQETNALPYIQSHENAGDLRHLHDEEAVPASPQSLYIYPTNDDALTRISTGSTNPEVRAAKVNKNLERFSDLRSEDIIPLARAGSIPTVGTKNGASDTGYLGDDESYVSDTSLPWENLVPILDGVGVCANPTPGDYPTEGGFGGGSEGERQRGRSSTARSGSRRPQCSSCDSVWLCPGDDDDSSSDDDERRDDNPPDNGQTRLDKFHEKSIIWVNLFFAAIGLLLAPFSASWRQTASFMDYLLHITMMLCVGLFIWWAAPALIIGAAFVIVAWILMLSYMLFVGETS